MKDKDAMKKKDKVIIKVKEKIKRLLAMLGGMFCPIQKKVFFESYKGRQYSDNPRAISEKLHEMYPEYKIVWAFSGEEKNWPGGLPDYVSACSCGSRRYRMEMASSCAYVRNEAMTRDLYKKEKQLFVQTWHGDRGIKRILYDSLQARGIAAARDEYCDEFLTDVFVAGSDYAEKRIRTAFRYQGKVLKTGCPRNDCLIVPGKEDEIRRKIGIPEGKKILLYAPTLRRNRKVLQATLDIDETIRHLEGKGGEWICLVRAHPKSLGLEVHSGSPILDVSGYPDMADLLMIADCLITDYSSCAGDFALKRKPLFLAQFDLEQYMEEDRTFYVDIKEIGFLIARSQEELDSLIDTMDERQYAENCEDILQYFGTKETGHSAEDVCRLIDKHYRELFVGK